MAAARDVFVNNVTGDDRLDGFAPVRGDAYNGPVKTVGRALEIVTKSGRVVLAKTEQPYRETLSLSARSHNGTPDEPLIIVGNGAVLDGTKPIPQRAWEHYFEGVF